VGDGFGIGAAEVCGGDLESVEQDGSAFVIDVAGGEAAEDLVESELNGGAVLDAGHGEDAEAVGAGSLVADAGVVVAELLAAEGGRAAAVAASVDVTADVAAERIDEWIGEHL
jgi:hypothetical protein